MNKCVEALTSTISVPGATKFLKCAHPVTDDKEGDTMWLEQGTEQAKALEKIVNDKKTLTDIERLSNFHHTGCLESFHALLLKWCPKRHNYFSEAMRARSQLAALFHNHNVAREQAKTKDGALCYRLVFPKAKGQWIIKKKYERTTAAILHELMDTIHATKMALLEGNTPPCITEYAIPVDIPKNIARIEIPDKAAAVTQHMSRMQQ